ncbi:hypothetical protein [Nocardioides sp. cx-173]|uniref:hypothetical protein n=1 Tax=Nocardioides sp. cx-173 TaxID=2898796 RepID=UPI001E513CF4|nr:hypothetical protein [Nocardioides sp. cx-173]MCD4524465.1 hypothetical protein [Nocardioides sp. cx-173]UGB43049.1 hypothetical protein LQ940_05870 [Nocardioides sp. cx-173]
MPTARVVPRRGLLLRAALATLEIMLGTVAAHTAAGGSLPSGAWTGLAAALVFGGSLLVLRGTVPLGIAVPALTATQLLLHCWLVALGPAHDMAPHVAAGPHAAAVGPPLELSAPMLAAHVAAALLTAAVWHVRRRAVEVLLAWSDLAPPAIPARPASAAPRPAVTPLGHGLLHAAPRRGPPALPAPA